MINETQVLFEIDPLIGTDGSLAGTSDPLTGSFTVSPSDSPGVLEVTGQGVISVPTTTAQIQVGIEVEGVTASEVQQEIAQLSTQVIDQLNELGVEDLETISVSLRPNINYDLGQNTVVGFTGTNILQFEIPTEQAGATIDAAIGAGANLIQNINFTAPEEELNQARLDALELAIQDAQSQGFAVLDSLDLEFLEISDIDILGVSNSLTPLPYLEVSTAAFDGSTPIIGGDQEVVANVALDINYEPL